MTAVPDAVALPALPPRFHWSKHFDHQEPRPYVFVGHELHGPWVAALEPAKGGRYLARLGRYRPQPTDRLCHELRDAVAYTTRWLQVHAAAIDAEYRIAMANGAGELARRLTREEKREIQRLRC